MLYYNHAIIKHISRKNVICNGDVMTKLYLLKVKEMETITAVITTQRWHQRLCHSSFDKIKCLDHVFNCDKHDNSIPCIVCPVVQHKRLGFVSSNNISNKTFELVYCDTWGALSHKFIPRFSIFYYYYWWLYKVHMDLFD